MLLAGAAAAAASARRRRGLAVLAAPAKFTFRSVPAIGSAAEVTAATPMENATATVGQRGGRSYMPVRAGAWLVADLARMPASDTVIGMVIALR